MIVKEIITIGGNEYEHTYSDANRYVVRDGVSYGDAIDQLNSGREYTEGEEMPHEETELSAQETLDIILGGETE